MHIIPPFHPSAVTLFAVFLPEPTPIVSFAVRAGLTLVCVIVAGLGLLAGFNRDDRKRKGNRKAISEFPLVHSRPEHAEKNDVVET